MIRKMICIVCPNGCQLEVQDVNDDILVTGNLCPRGKEYAINESICPKRHIASTAKVKNGILEVVPVHTAEKVRKETIFDCMNIIRSLEVEAPISMNDIIYDDGTLKLKASCDVERGK